jgi:hypothetical protein
MRYLVPYASLLLLLACNSEAPIQDGSYEGDEVVPMSAARAATETLDSEAPRSESAPTAPLQEPIIVSAREALPELLPGQTSAPIAELRSPLEQTTVEFGAPIKGEFSHEQWARLEALRNAEQAEVTP